ncbi:probable PHO91 - similarity to Pho87p and Pho90p [Melanopsichium pennsylvanicum]|uniref:Probable PHO91 - similarity to Pho87p and Pho90p n=2 Tax=Melanopsichium pennsylvanicum TaxID=63383 RepID=A0AAJ4XU88_9BASI|nr:probable PHO91-similarity to Pho87p and Pho90p [Melanopsichium pennsylvanicum 4]SNX87653.1 probable PHO91 - similarity to Pho87p and Pho90p [Melanopsichium pennsylvanicum]
MKFSHSLQFNSVPDWADKYIAYSNLKKSIYIMEKEIQSIPNAPYSDIENESSGLLSSAHTSDTDKSFVPLLDMELNKIVEFYLKKQDELRANLQHLNVDIERTENDEFQDDSDFGLSDDDDEDQDLMDTVRTGKASTNRRPSIDDLFTHPRKYNEASRQEQRMRDGSGPSRSRKNSRATDDASNPTAHPNNNRNRSSQLLDVSTDLSEAADTSGFAKRNRSVSNASQNTGSKGRWTGIFGKKPVRRQSLGLMHAADDAANSAAAGSSEAADSSYAADGAKSMSIWTADNDYAIDMRITFKKRITDLFVAMSELKQFVSLNETGMRKILKKYDKITKSDLKDRYMNDKLRKEPPFTAETKAGLEDCIETLIQLYAKVVTGGDIGAASQELKTHLREQVVWQRNTVWREMIGIERRAQGAALERTVMGSGKDHKYQTKKPFRLRTPCGSITIPSWLSMSTLHLIIAFTALVALLKAPGLRFFNRVEEQNCLAMLVFCTILWATEVIPLFVTSLMVPLLVVTLRVARTDDAKDRRMTASETTKWIFSQMFAPNMCLLLGGFTLAAALSKYGIDKILATKILRLAGTRPSVVLLAHMGVACFASMWISNVAAPVLMYSLIQPILRTLPSKSPYASSLIMGIALASNIGGQTSPIASPQNLIALQYMKQPVGWLQWFAVTIPVSGLSLVVIWLILLWSYGGGKGTVIKKLGESRDSFTKIQWFISAVAISTIALWCLEKNFEWIVGDMGIIAIVPMVLLFGTGILTKEDFNTFLWTVVFLAMGGIALGKAVTSSGLLESLDDLIQEIVKEMSLWQILIALLGIGLVVATFISHTIAAVLLVPIAAQVGESLETPHPRLLIMATTLVASAAMGLPVSGYPNQIAVSMEDDLGDRYVNVKDFLKVGILASVVATLIVGSIGVVIMYALQF